MSYSLEYINERVHSDAVGFVGESEADYGEKITRGAEMILANRGRSPIVLLSGPSGSGKTTTAKRLCDELELRGIKAHNVSLDNYFITPHRADAPLTEAGAVDFESPQMIDWTLLDEHFSELEGGAEILIPHFSFSMQRRVAARAKPLVLGRDEIAIFEGIHALNDRITDRHGGAFRLYISARSDFERDGAVYMKRTWTRLIRRTIRDSNFRGASAEVTLAMWANVRRGEKKYISPFKDTADLQFDTTLAYELCAMRGKAIEVLSHLPETAERYGEVRDIVARLPDFEEVDCETVPRSSIIREFLGDSCYLY
ncbi:MAG: nucleoside kinase [Oscillospiraceae bacterium]|jgi:uridine kinase|nr:nucleoside kinase [Oscillospiraceae bacterium]